MEASFSRTSDIYMENTYKVFRTSLVKMCKVFLSLKIICLAVMELNNGAQLIEFVIPNLTLIYFIVFLYLELTGSCKKKLLFVLSEMVNLNCYIYGLFSNPSYREIYVISSAVITCGVQMVCFTEMGSWVLIFKLVFIWFILPIGLGWKELPTVPTPYLSVLFIIIILSQVYTHRKRLEQDFIEANCQISKMKIQLYSILQALPESVIIFSESQEVILYNIACQDLFKIKNSQSIQQLLQTFDYSPNGRTYTGPGDTFYEDILHYLHTDHRQSITLGTILYEGKSLEWRASKSEWDKQSVLILTTRDITTLIAYERTKAEAQSKTAILRTVSHELRTPTNAMISLSEAILDSGDMNPDNLEKVKIIHISSKLLLCLISDLLDFSRLIADSFSINKCEFVLSVYLEEVYSLFMIQCSKKGLEYKLYIDPLLPYVIYTDPNRLRQIIINLMGNALKFTIQGNIELRAIMTEQANLLIEVVDSGLGIPIQKLDNLFDSFNRTHDMKLNPEGCGLGLYISNILSNILGGSNIQVSSKVNEGSKFSFEISTGLNQSICIESTDEELQESLVSFERSNISVPRILNAHDSFTNQIAEVLIVDDDEFNRLIMKNFLRDSGIQYQEAASGQEAIDKILAANRRILSIKVIVMDCNLPGKSGPEASSEIRSLYEEKEIVHLPAIIAYTSDDTEENREICRNCGMIDYLTKPCSKHAFLNIIKKYIL